jgi:hypothetical protein
MDNPATKNQIEFLLIDLDFTSQQEPGEPQRRHEHANKILGLPFSASAHDVHIHCFSRARIQDQKEEYREKSAMARRWNQ